jgi:hypothetical protein
VKYRLFSIGAAQHYPEASIKSGPNSQKEIFDGWCRDYRLGEIQSFCWRSGLFLEAPPDEQTGSYLIIATAKHATVEMLNPPDFGDVINSHRNFLPLSFQCIVIPFMAVARWRELHSTWPIMCFTTGSLVFEQTCH